jgi:hypothetical protein
MVPSVALVFPQHHAVSFVPVALDGKSGSPIVAIFVDALRVAGHESDHQPRYNGEIQKAHLGC